MTTTPTDTGTAPPDPWSLSAKEAGAELERLAAVHAGPAPTAAPTTALQARERLASLGRDSDFINKYQSGDIGARETFDALTKMIDGHKDPVAGLLRGEPAPNETRVGPGYATLRQIAEVIPSLREDGLTDGQIHQLATDHVFTEAEVAAVQRLQNELHGTAAWREKLLAGDAEAKREQLLMSCVLLQKRANVDSGQRKTLSVVLAPEEIASLRAHPWQAGIYKAAALRHAYREARGDGSSGWRHTGGIKQIILN
jgi:hypothetical protein